MGWNDNTMTTITNNSNEVIDAFKDARTANRNTRAGDAEDELAASIGEYTLVGINATKLDGVITTLDDYLKSVMSAVDEMNEYSSATLSKAFASEEIKHAITTYVDHVGVYCRNLVSQLRIFGDQLVEVKEAWAETERKASENIAADTASVKSDSGTERMFEKAGGAR